MASRKERRLGKLDGRREKRYLQEEEPRAKPSQRHNGFYQRHYKKLFLISIAMLVFGLVQLSVQYVTTGDVMLKGVSLQGGLTITAPLSTPVDPDVVQATLRAQFPNNDISVRAITEFGQQRAIFVEATGNTEDAAVLDELQAGVLAALPTSHDYTVEVIGPSLGRAFFQQTIQAVMIAFLLMGMVVFLFFADVGLEAQKRPTRLLVKALVVLLSLIASYCVYHGTTFLMIVAAVLYIVLIVIYVLYSIPSAAVMLAAFSDIIITLAIVNLLGVKMSTAGIAAFLMLIGYSVDTDILLSVRALKRREGTLDERITSSMKTGLLMVSTTFTVAFVSLMLSDSEVIKQIMLIVLIGTIIDIANTWIQNAGIIKWWAERHGY